MGATNLEGQLGLMGGAAAHMGWPHPTLKAHEAEPRETLTLKGVGALGGKFPPLGRPKDLGEGKPGPPRLYKEEGRAGAHPIQA